MKADTPNTIELQESPLVSGWYKVTCTDASCGWASKFVPQALAEELAKRHQNIHH